MSPAPRPLSVTARRRRRAAGERIAELFGAHARMVYGICRLILRDPSEAEDAAQQTFLSAYRGLLAGQEPREPSAWLGTIARNECRARLRNRSTEPLTLVTEPSGDETQREVARHAEAEALCSALAELPPQQRDAIVLREFYGLSYAEVAAALGLSAPAVESLLFRSRRRLQEQLRPLRAALGVLTVPPSLGESLAQALPGFGGSTAATVGVGALAKLGSTSFGAKLAATALALGTAGTVAGLERNSHHHAARKAPAAQSARANGSRDAVPISAPAPIAPSSATSLQEDRSSGRSGRETRHERGRGERQREGGGGSSEPVERPGGDGTGRSGSDSSSHDGGSTSGGGESSSSGPGGGDHLDGGTSGGDSGTSTTESGSGSSGSGGGSGEG